MRGRNTRATDGNGTNIGYMKTYEKEQLSSAVNTRRKKNTALYV